ncbi:uncharacterized protein N0V89_011193 [Didymosphaeria variabile]|uniref:Rhodopsin domain-containing protein n=1 Tax=Didymosphaeria variabile TaxID=1932322 RepID=A0A9W8XD14_9PLEO|nr:uncharacterized protein N0V89_011193 [Didymosphaeria variabile]KAJ4347253.1 hypothetical protein N0V89_011193 [Didymosphaeria variabile]
MLPPQAVTITIVSVIFPVLSVTAVALRIYARRLKGTRLNASDYMIFFTLVRLHRDDEASATKNTQLNAVLNAIACIIGAVACGIGLPLAGLTPTLKVRFLKILFVTQFFYVFSVWSVKASVLLFYQTVFATPGFRRAVIATQLVLLAWIIAFFFVTLFQDNPIPRNWGEPGTAINWRIFYIVEIATDVALDIFILCLPLPVIHRLRISKKKKWLISGVFWLGAVIVVASTVRLYYMVKVKQEFQDNDDDFSCKAYDPLDQTLRSPLTVTTINTIIWGSIEPCMSVVAACLPILGPVFFKNKREDASKPTKTSAMSSYFRKVTLGSKGRHLGGNYSRAIDSIDRLQTQEESISMKSLVPGEPENDQTKSDAPAIYVQRGFSVKGSR